MKTTYQFELSDSSIVITESCELAERLRKVYAGRVQLDPYIKTHYRLSSTNVVEVRK